MTSTELKRLKKERDKLSDTIKAGRLFECKFCGSYDTVISDKNNTGLCTNCRSEKRAIEASIENISNILKDWKGFSIIDISLKYGSEIDAILLQNELLQNDEQYIIVEIEPGYERGDEELSIEGIDIEQWDADYSEREKLKKYES